MDVLTPTEHQILKLIAESGRAAKPPPAFGIGLRTVEHHRNNIATKRDLHGSHALVKFALKHQAELQLPVADYFKLRLKIEGLMSRKPAP